MPGWVQTDVPASVRPELDVLRQRVEAAPRGQAAVHPVECLVDAVRGQCGVERRHGAGGELGVEAVDQRLVRLAPVGEPDGVVAGSPDHEYAGSAGSAASRAATNAAWVSS